MRGANGSLTTAGRPRPRPGRLAQLQTNGPTNPLPTGDPAPAGVVWPAAPGYGFTRSFLTPTGSYKTRATRGVRRPRPVDREPVGHPGRSRAVRPVTGSGRTDRLRETSRPGNERPASQEYDRDPPPEHRREDRRRAALPFWHPRRLRGRRGRDRRAERDGQPYLVDPRLLDDFPDGDPAARPYPGRRPDHRGAARPRL